jgi:hypothetical protein
MKRLLAVLTVLAVGATACGDTASTTIATDGVAVTTTVVTTTSTATTVAATTAPPTTAPPTTTLPPAPDGWIGEPIDFWVPVPEEGPIVGVVGVRYDDILNVRSGPDITFDIVGTLDPTLTGISGTGNGWQLPSGSVWWEIEVDDVVGWANQRFLSRLDGVDDLTSFVVDQLGELPAAETMLDLGLAVADVFVFSEGGTAVVSVAPAVGDLGEVTYDVIGIGDDSVGGYRLHIFGQPTESGEGFSLKSVEATIMCQRGVSGDVCV